MPTCHRLFFALLPPAVQRANIAAIRDAQAGLRSKVADERLHMTMGIGEDFVDFPDAVAERMRQIGERVSAAPAEVVLDRIAGSHASVALRPSRRSCGLDEIARSIGGGLAHAGLSRAGWRFNPHVTLGYLKGEPFNRPAEPIAWQADAFELIHSLVGETRHLSLGRWLLRADQGALFDRTGGEG